MTSSQAAIIDLVKAWDDRTGNLPSLPGIYPDRMAPVVINSPEGRVLTNMRGDAVVSFAGEDGRAGLITRTHIGVALGHE